jgi:hypothetical protein
MPESHVLGRPPEVVRAMEGAMRRAHALIERSSSLVALMVVVVLVALVAPAGRVDAVGPPAPAGALSPQEAPGDRERLWSNGCIAAESRTAPRTCVFGATGSSFTLALVGDSHASHLFAAFERLAKQRGWRLVVFTKVSCPFLDIPVRNFFSGLEYTQCATWNRNVLARLKAIVPDLTVTVAFRGIRPMDRAKDTPAREGAAIGRMLRQVPGRRAIIVDSPWSERNIPDCLMADPAHPLRCRIPSSQVLIDGVRTREQKAADVGRATYIDLTTTICAGFPCRVIRKGVVMFRDRHHLTNTYAGTLRDPLGAALDRALD